MTLDLQTQKDRAWNAARTDLMKNNAKVVDPVLQRCIKYGSPHDMDEACWTALLAEYPQ